jgi:hypothetical protein
MEVSERVGEPIQWVLRSTTSIGAAYSHLREEDGLEHAISLASNISIVTSDSGRFVSVLPSVPVKTNGVSTSWIPEHLFFRAREGETTTFSLMRPGYNAANHDSIEGSEIEGSEQVPVVRGARGSAST